MQGRNDAPRGRLSLGAALSRRADPETTGRPDPDDCRVRCFPPGFAGNFGGDSNSLQGRGIRKKASRLEPSDQNLLPSSGRFRELALPGTAAGFRRRISLRIRKTLSEFGEFRLQRARVVK